MEGGGKPFQTWGEIYVLSSSEAQTLYSSVIILTSWHWKKQRGGRGKWWGLLLVMINSRRKSCRCYTREQAIIERETTKDPRRGWLRRKARSWASSVVLPHTQPPICSACSSDFPPVPRGVARGSINIASNGSRSRCWFKSPCGREGERGWFVSNVTRLLLATLSLHNLQPLTPCPVPPSLFFHISSMADTWDWLCKAGVVKTRISIHWWAFEWPITKIQVPSVGKGKEKEIFPAGKEKRNVSRWKRKMNKGSPAQTVAKTRARWKRGCGHRQQRLDFHTRWQKQGKLKLH